MIRLIRFIIGWPLFYAGIAILGEQNVRDIVRHASKDPELIALLRRA